MLVPFHEPEIGSPTDSIICNVFPTDQGLRIHVRFPRRVSPRDRQKVLEWLYHYRSEVRRQNPYWLAKLTDTQQELTLDFVSADGPRESLANALRLGHEGGYGGIDYATL